MQIATLFLASLVMHGPAKLEIKDIVVGKGAPAQAGDLLVVDYTGTLLSGTKFDSSKGGAPFAFELGAGQVIPGWDKGMAGMRVGGKRSLVIPSEMAYGDAGSGPIPPKSTLKFEIELYRIDKKGAKPAITMSTTKPGTGAGAKTGDTIFVHYRGSYLNGTGFDNSYDRKQPLKVTIGTTRLIAGFTQGLEGMKMDEKRTVIIPSALAYGPGGRGPIPPNMALKFELWRVVGENQ